jgi:hypothetical protein
MWRPHCPFQQEWMKQAALPLSGARSAWPDKNINRAVGLDEGRDDRKRNAAHAPMNAPLPGAMCSSNHA